MRPNPHQTDRAAQRRATTRILCALGTLAHNRPFSSSDVAQYVYVEGIGRSVVTAAMVSFKKKGWIDKVEQPRNHWYPTRRGWRAIELACRMPAGRR
jgi:hypothetical protein